MEKRFKMAVEVKRDFQCGHTSNRAKREKDFLREKNWISMSNSWMLVDENAFYQNAIAMMYVSVVPMGAIFFNFPVTHSEKQICSAPVTLCEFAR